MNNIKYFLLLTLLSGWKTLCGQVTTEPAVPSSESHISIIYDATLGSSELTGASKVYMHSGVILSSPTGTSWSNVIGNWGEDDGVGEMSRIEGETDKWIISINPREYYNVPSAPIYRIGMVFRSADGEQEGKSASNGDIFVELIQDSYGVIRSSPSQENFLVSNGEEIDIEVQASEPSEFTLRINSNVITAVNGTSTFTYTHTVSDTEGNIPVEIEATNGVETASVSFEYIVRSNTATAPRPANLKRGINYDPGDNTKVSLVLEAPLKNSVYVLGDFNDWKISDDYQMIQDGDFFWLEISGLSPNQEYRFQYMIDETIYVADPYSEKISDPEDQFISQSTYPNLLPYPNEAIRDRWYYQRASVIETNQTAFDWQIADFEKPEKDKLVIYELLIRDFFGPGQRNYKNLIDTLDYLENLGINAIQLMPITEFNGNESWGYNPTFMFAADKAYGSKEDLKTFIDAAHQRGMAVILDMVLNHQDIPNPYAVMYYEDGIAAENPWFNVTPKHPFNVFFDMDHESPYTQAYIDSVNLYWLEEYKFDGYRYDLSKGFTQFDSGEDVGLWSSYDQSRIDLLKRMADKVWSAHPDAYIILEHFAANSEEKVLADYGMMLWGNMHSPYKQLAMGFASNSDIRGISAKQRGWNERNLIGYMESHDEERIIYECLQFGNSVSGYSIKDNETALERVKAASAFLYTIPGPKMLWQFGELGFPYSINRCTDGSVDQNCRLAIKPPVWEFLQELPYQKLYATVSELIKLKTSYSVFQSGDITFFNPTNLTRYFWVTQNSLTNPASPAEMNALIVGNFDVRVKELQVDFPHDGNWYHYFDQGDSLDVVGSQTLRLEAGEFRIYTDVPLPQGRAELMPFLKPLAPSGLTASDQENGIQLNWENNSQISTGNRVYRASAESDFELIAEIGIEETYLDRKVKNGDLYTYIVSSFNASGENTSLPAEAIAESFIALKVNAEASIKLFPNPAQSMIWIQSNEEFDSFLIMDLAGKTMITGESTEQIDISSLRIGTYLLRLSSENGLETTTKFIKVP